MVRSLGGGKLGKDKIFGAGLFQYVKSKEKREKSSAENEKRNETC